MKRKSAKPLATECLNCNTPLSGPFCHHCGQENTHYVRGIGSLITEFFGEMGNWDGRVWQTLFPLFFRPAFLSNQYMRGRRVPYVPPLRLYLFISIIAFIVFSQISHSVSIGSSSLSHEEQQALYETLDEPPVNDSDLARFTAGEQHLSIGFLSDEVNAELNQKVRFLLQHPKILIDKFFAVAPQILLILLPIFAVVLKLFYIRSKRYYIEHLILALHTHAFLLIALMLLMAIGRFTTSDAPAILSTPVTVVTTANYCACCLCYP